MNIKRFLVFLCVFLLALAIVPAQTQSSGGRQMTVEESYLQQSVELLIIREQSRADNRDMKFIALEYIADAINKGNTGPEIKDALEYLGFEGIVNKTMENGRLMNNYPDVRVKAATYLGLLGTPEAKESLIRMCVSDNEPMVLTEVIKSLGRIGLNDDNRTTDTISWIINVNILYNSTPDNLMALSALEAYEKIAAATGTIDQRSIEIVMRISQDQRYITPVRDRATQTLSNLRMTNLQNQNR